MISLFFSYSHKDEDLRNELETHLTLLKRQGVVSTWHDRRITAGSDIHQGISAELESAEIVLLLVSAHFLASEYCYDREMMRALARHEAQKAVVIPVILHPCDWHSAPFGHLRATPTDGKAVSMFGNQHEAFAIVAKDVREAATAFKPSTERHAIAADSTASGSHIISGPRSSNLRVKRKVDDHERDAFLAASFEYIARYFEGSLSELEKRNSHIKTRFNRLDAKGFSASIYSYGERVATCSIWYGGRTFGSEAIAFSFSEDGRNNSMNEMLSVVDDGHTVQLQHMGMNFLNKSPEGLLSQEGAAEYYWSMLIARLQA